MCDEKTKYREKETAERPLRKSHLSESFRESSSVDVVSREM
jgi:hypothetical protein